MATRGAVAVAAGADAVGLALLLGAGLDPTAASAAPGKYWRSVVVRRVVVLVELL
jgi:hypothetical protein